MMEISSSTNSSIPAAQSQQTPPPQQQAQQEQQTAELEAARTAPDPEQRSGTIINTQA
ncbi:hypothetical protein [Neptunicella sp. SCSIO 80796]|uniref:hypothetical protein n=1 Tax=Neptunicella plasticusilytica TaxID=3117012 RepID=UPI003A4E164F